MEFIIVFILGLAAGSFLNSVVYRLNEGGPIFSFKTRSFCPTCKHILQWIDLIPLVSFFVLGGKCRFCRNAISPWYAVGELAGGVFFSAIWFFLASSGAIEFLQGEFNFWGGFEIIYIFALGFFLLGIFISDLRYFTIPDIFVFILFFQTLGAIAIQHFLHPFSMLSSFLPSFWTSIGGGIAGLLFFFPIVFFSREKWMGGGDVKYGILMGIVLGLPSLAVGLYLAFVAGALIGLILILAKRKTLKSEIPFGAFLVPSTLVAFFWGAKLQCMVWPC